MMIRIYMFLLHSYLLLFCLGPLQKRDIYTILRFNSGPIFVLIFFLEIKLFINILYQKTYVSDVIDKKEYIYGFFEALKCTMFTLFLIKSIRPFCFLKRKTQNEYNVFKKVSCFVSVKFW